MTETGRRFTIEVTEEMIKAASRELQLFDPEFSTALDGARNLIVTALLAGGYIVANDRASDRVHA